MTLTCRKTLVIGLLVPGLFADCGSLFASQKIQPIMKSAEMQHDLSTNEALLMQFQNEKEALLRDKSKNSAPHLLKNKLKILDAKITFLQSELRRTKSVKIENQMAAKPALQTPKILKAKTAKAPLVVSWHPYAKLEPRRRIFIAKMRNVQPQPMSVPSVRQHAATLAVAKKIQLRAQAAPAERRQPMAHPVAVLPAIPEQKTAKTGRDWKGMTEAEKDIYTLSIMGNLGRRDVFLEKSHSFYIRAIDEKLKNTSALDDEYVHKILIASAYENEPESRQDIDKIGQ